MRLLLLLEVATHLIKHLFLLAGAHSVLKTLITLQILFHLVVVELDIFKKFLGFVLFVVAVLEGDLDFLEILTRF